MIKQFNIAEIFSETICLGGKSNGKFLRNEIEIALDVGEVCVNFENLPLVTQSFSDEFLGPLVSNRGKQILRSITFKHCSGDIQELLAWTAKRFLNNKQGTP